MSAKHLCLFVVVMAFLTGCDVTKEKDELDSKLAVLYAEKAEVGAKLSHYSSLGVYKNGQCQLIERGVQPAFSCDGTAAQTQIPAALCGVSAARYCLHRVGSTTEDRVGSQFCGDVITSSFRQADSNIVTLEIMEDAYAVDALQKCEGVLCQPTTPMILYQGDVLKEKVMSSTASCLTHVTNACQNRYREWYERPEKLNSECQPLTSHLAAITQEISPLERRLDTIKRSFKYKFLHLIEEIW